MSRPFVTYRSPEFSGKSPFTLWGALVTRKGAWFLHLAAAAPGIGCWPFSGAFGDGEAMVCRAEAKPGTTGHCRPRHKRAFFVDLCMAADRHEEEEGGDG